MKVNSNVIAKSKIKPRYVTELVIKYVIFAILLVILLFPFFFMISKSLMTYIEVTSTTEVKLLPAKLNFENYLVFKDYAKYFMNSLIVVIINMVGVPIVSCIIAFPLARYKFKGRNLMFTLILATSMIPSAVLQVPQYFLFESLGLVNTLASQYINAFLGGSGMQIFLVIQFIRGVPGEICDAGRIDGANKFLIFIAIVMPLCLNVCVYLGISMAIAKWNDFQGPLIYIHDDNIRTIAYAFYYHFGSSGAEKTYTNIKMAMAVCMTIFPALLFFFFQKQMIGGVKVGGLKG